MDGWNEPSGLFWCVAHPDVAAVVHVYSSVPVYLHVCVQKFSHINRSRIDLNPVEHAAVASEQCSARQSHSASVSSQNNKKKLKKQKENQKKINGGSIGPIQKLLGAA